jgi:hypothetical protein
MMNFAARKLLQKRAQESHATWIQAFDTEGPFISIPVAKKTWGDVVPRLSAEAHEAFRLRFSDFVKAYDALDGARLSALSGLSAATERLESQERLFREIQGEWVAFVLRDLAKWGDRLETFTDPNPEFAAHNPNGTVTTSASGRLLRDGEPHALLLTVDPVDSLRQDGKDGWSANLIDRMGEMLRTAEIGCGIVTDGRWWSVVWADTRKDATKVSTIGSGVADGLNWASDLLTRDAYVNLICLKSLSGADESQRLDALIGDSLLDAEQITESLGTQVRGAVELLVQAFSESSLNSRKLGLPDPLPAETHHAYEAAVTVMMRVVFLLFAEERGLMPTGEMYRTAYSIAGQLDDLDERRRHDGDESLERTEVWHRLLAASAALYDGASFDDVRMPAYGGSLFDPQRFPWMEGTGANGLAIRVSDRVMLEVLRSVQYAETGSGRTTTRQKLSFRDIDVEQIGYIYEGLLGYTCKRVPEGQVVLGIVGKQGSEPEISIDKLEELYIAADGDDTALAKKLIEFWKTNQPSAVAKSPAQLTKVLSDIDTTQNETVDLKIRHLIEDDETRNQIASWGNLIRRDLRGIPFVIPEGGLVVEETKSRANAGAHYTPRSLAEEVVLHALQPLCYEPGPLQTSDSNAWKLRSSTEILNLRIADIAVGSGAFLVAAARYLGERLLEAWQQESATGGDHTGRDLNLAIREVVSQCLYGADINEMAVEMCKLSLWLVSLDPKKPFSFVDDKVLHGNSLLGLTEVKQLRGLHINPSARRLQSPGFTVDIEAPLQKAADIRAKLATPIADQAERDPQRSAKHKKALLAESKIVTEHLRTVADGIVAAGLRLGGRPGSGLEAAYENLSLALLKAHPNSAADADPTMLENIIRSGLTPTVETDYTLWKPLHWVVELPDVMIGHGGFDAVIGNPPFLGGQKLTGSMGDNVRDWMVNVLASGRKGSADLVAYFFLRAHDLLNVRTGQLGLIATNSVAQGTTEEVGLRHLAANGLTIRRAIRTAPWPAKSAAIEFSAVWGTIPELEQSAVSSADGVQGPVSSLLLVEGRVVGQPIKLAANAGLAFQGANILGKGFMMEPQEAEEMIASDPRNSDVLFPFLNGEDLLSPYQAARRWCVNFHDMDLDVAETFILPMKRIRDLVYEERQKNNRSARRERWWHYAEKSPGLVRAIAPLEEVLVMTLHSTTLTPVRVTSNQVFSHALCVFATDSVSLQGLLSSQIHFIWAAKYSSSLGISIRYRPSEVFESLPLPDLDSAVENAMRELEEAKSKVMAAREIGLTNVFNLVHDASTSGQSEIDEIRRRQQVLDETVLAAYGWSDIDTEYGFHEFRKERRWTFAPHVSQEVLDRLLEENHRRAALQPVRDVGKRSPRSKQTNQLIDVQEKMF